MTPRISAGDLVLVQPAASYGVGDSVAYRSDVMRTTVLHRIVAVEGDRYVFQGDNNDWLDPEKPTRAELIGKELLHIPQGGIWLKRLTSPPTLAIAAFLLLAAGGTARTRRSPKKGPMSRHAARPSRSTQVALAALPPQLRSVAAGTAAVGVLGLVLGTFGWSGPTDTDAPERAGLDRSMTFAYSTTVPLTAAYDGTEVTAPDPVFRALTESVDVHLAYQGAPGSMAVDAVLSTASGWRSTVPLAAAEPFAADQHETTVRLDLPALEARAQEAAEITGMPADQLTVTVVPTVEDGAEPPFTPELALTLTSQQLKLAGDAASLTVSESSAAEQAGSAARTLTLLGREITADTARTLSAVLVAAALLAAGLLAGAARFLAPTTEGAGIRQRYGPLLLPVNPMPTPSGRPVVDVTEFTTLARLAERYGLMVLHWSRSDVETFVVQDEGTTYRYRTGTGEEADAADATAAVPAQVADEPTAAIPTGS